MKYQYNVWESNVIVRGRPKKLTSTPKEDFEDDDVDAYIGVTDTWVDPPAGTPFVWMPWNEGRYPSPELFYAVNRSLLWFTHYKKYKHIEVYCDAGTHRSVTVFGAFLMTYFSAQERKRIVHDRICIDAKELYEIDRANPLEYIEGYLNEFPEDYLLFKAMGKDYLGRLDGHTRMIYDNVKNRYGDRP